MTTHAKILEMLSLQDSMNNLVNADWQTARYSWYRAIYVEGSELLDHLGNWKWWKKGTPELSQAQLELVDIWHFGLSTFLEDARASGDSRDFLAAKIELEMMAARAKAIVVAKDDPESANQYVDTLVGEAALNKRFDMGAFTALMVYLGLDIDTLYALYFGKNALNRFRQENGYKAGTYLKNWNGEEDNVHLMRVLERRKEAAGDFSEWIYSELKKAYPG